MPKDEAPLKSAYELAMERLRAEDSEEPAPLSGEQKAEIARLRREAEAKLAELEIMHRDHLDSNAGDAAELEKVEEHYRIDRRRVESGLESAVERIRRGESD